MALSRIERLDIVAGSKITAQIISYARIALLILTPFFILLAVNSEAPRRETILVNALAAMSVVTTIVLWLDWRFKVYVLAVFCFLFALGDTISSDHRHPHTLLGWFAAKSLAWLFVYYGCGLWLMARRFSLTNGSAFREERDLVEKWMLELNSANALGFPSGTFWTGYWTYRILNRGECWLVAQFKRKTTKLRSCRIYELKDVSIQRMPSGRWQIDIFAKGKKRKSFFEVDVSPGSSTGGLAHPSPVSH